MHARFVCLLLFIFMFYRTSADPEPDKHAVSKIDMLSMQRKVIERAKQIIVLLIIIVVFTDLLVVLLRCASMSVG